VLQAESDTARDSLLMGLFFMTVDRTWSELEHFWRRLGCS
jgi:hypothetical protein